MSTNKEMQAVAEMLYREGWNAAINAAIKSRSYARRKRHTCRYTGAKEVSVGI